MSEDNLLGQPRTMACPTCGSTGAELAELWDRAGQLRIDLEGARAELVQVRSQRGQARAEAERLRAELTQLRDQLARLTDRWLCEATDPAVPVGTGRAWAVMAAEVRELLPADQRYDNGPGREEE